MPCVVAQDFSSYEDVDLIYSIGSKLSVRSTGGNSRIVYADARIKLFPDKEFEGQKVLNLDIDTNPRARVTTDHDLFLEWDSLQADELSYKLEARLNVGNRLKKIQNKIQFPVRIDMNEYLKEQEFIDFNDKIIKKANELVKDTDDYYEAVFKIADWVKKNIRYDINTLTEKSVQKSSWVFANKEGVCDELTNLFISMLRSQGIPARFVSGMVYTNVNQDWGNHGWAEVYFPEHGWVSFDVTFGQYGWIDPSHVKLSDTSDSGETSVEYNWKVRDYIIEANGLDIKTKFGRNGKKQDKVIDVKVESVYSEVGFGSFYPIRVVVSNLEDYYISQNIRLAESTKLENSNSKEVLLKPGEVKELYWIAKAPEALKKDYVYEAKLKARSSFGAVDESFVRFSEDSKVYNYEDVEGFVDIESKRVLETVDLLCEYDAEEYYTDEKVAVNCLVKNKLDHAFDVKVCLREKCKEFLLEDEERVLFSSEAFESMRIRVETSDAIKYVDLGAKVIRRPEVYVSDFEPEEVEFRELSELKFLLTSNYEAYDVVLFIEGYKIDIGDLEGERKIIIDILGKDLINGLSLKIVYYDEKGKEYVDSGRYDIKVKNVPWYWKIFSLF